MHVKMLEGRINRDIRRIEDMGGYGSTEEIAHESMKKLCEELHLWKLLCEYKKKTEIETISEEVVIDPVSGEKAVFLKKQFVPHMEG
jgi:hypothetical protein